MQSGIYLTYKQVGQSSFDIVREFKKKSLIEDSQCLTLGHGGTLDPFAEGLLLILAGQATRLMELMHNLPKTYLAKITWGNETDTCDHLGNIVATGKILPNKTELENILPNFLGWLDQIPPTTCAKKINGEPAYKKVRRGEIVSLPASRVYLHKANWIEHNLPHYSILRIVCKGGYYVRALARDIGRSLGYMAHLSNLIRTNIGPWEKPNIGSYSLITGEDLIPWCPLRFLSEHENKYLCHGRSILLGNVENGSWILPDQFLNISKLPIRGIYNKKLVTLMHEKNNLLYSFANLRGGL